MKRLHLFEIGDQPWCPAVVRDGGTAYITGMCELLGLLDGIEPHLLKLLAAHPNGRIVDLCSGAAGPAIRVSQLLAARDVQVHCTDLFPNRAALTYAASRSDGRVTFSERSVDAMAVPAELSGPRTMFNAFHHFRPEQARRILEDAVHAREPIGVFELVGRQLPAIPASIGIPLVVASVVPMLRPFHWGWIPLTYLLPVLPLAIAFDGVVSCLRVYDPSELRDLVCGLDTYDWDIGTFPLPFPGRGTYLVGTPWPA